MPYAILLARTQHLTLIGGDWEDGEDGCLVKDPGRHSRHHRVQEEEEEDSWGREGQEGASEEFVAKAEAEAESIQFVC